MTRNYSGEDLRGLTFGGSHEQNFVNADFTGAKLQEATFKNANLCNANFSGATLGGTNFEGAKLQGAKFIDVEVDLNESLKATIFNSAKLHGADFTDARLNRAEFIKAQLGLRRGGYVFILLITIIISLFSAFPTAIITAFSTYFLRSSRQKPSFRNILFIGFYSFLFTVILRTTLINLELNNLSVVLVFTGTIMIAIVLLGVFIGIAKDKFNSQNDLFNILSSTLPLLIFLVINLILIKYGVSLGIDDFIASHFSYLKKLIPSLGESATDDWFTAIFGAFIGAIFGCWFAWLSIIGDKKFDWLWNTYIQFVVRERTIFVGSDLTDTNFSFATLRGANFRDATLSRVSWKGAKYLDYAFFQNCYLEHPRVRQLVTGRRVKDKNFEGFDLEGINLEDASLENAFFIKANLKQSKLHNAILIGARFEKAILSGADLTGAKLTGICIENWIVDEKTIFDNVTCKYIFKEKLPGNMTGWRRDPPIDSEEFNDGEFREKYGKDTAIVEFTFNRNDNQRALEIALKRVIEQNPEIRNSNLFKEIRSIGDNVLITIRVSPNTNKSLLEQNFQKFYQQADKENPLSSEDIASHYDLPPLEFVLKIVQELKEIMSNPSSKAAKYDMSGSIIGSVGDNVSGDQNSTLNIYNQEKEKPLTEAAIEIQELLEQLAKKNPTLIQTTSQDIVVETIKKEINENPTIKDRLLSALRAGGTKALTQALEATFKNPLVSIPVETIKGFIEAE